MSFRQPAPPPKTALGRYRLLSPSASVRVSPLCLGAMNFGDAWKEVMGACDRDTTFAILDHYFDAGGNFVDTANNYQSEQSEAWIGEWMARRGNRDQLVLATKYTSNYQSYKGFEGRINANYVGNGSKSLHMSVRASLKKLQTDYIDLLYVHWWDFSTSIPELMQALNALVSQGLVLYLGASDLPAYVVSACNQYAREHALRGFAVYQGKWSAADRQFERDVLPLARDFGLGLCPWGALGGGNFKTQRQREAMEQSGEQGRRSIHVPPKAAKITDALEQVARGKKHPRDGEAWDVTSVALAYCMAKAAYVFPIVGGRKVEHLKGNIDALSLELTPEDLKAIDDADPDFDIGFPFSIFGARAEDNFLLQASANFDYVQPQQPIKPHPHHEEKTV